MTTFARTPSTASWPSRPAPSAARSICWPSAARSAGRSARPRGSRSHPTAPMCTRRRSPPARSTSSTADAESGALTQKPRRAGCLARRPMPQAAHSGASCSASARWPSAPTARRLRGGIRKQRGQRLQAGHQDDLAKAALRSKRSGHGQSGQRFQAGWGTSAARLGRAEGITRGELLKRAAVAAGGLLLGAARPRALRGPALSASPPAARRQGRGDERACVPDRPAACDPALPTGLV